MGGDGGTKAVNRSYLRGAGSATTSGDSVKHSKANDKALTDEETTRVLRCCALSDEALVGHAVVACDLGKLYIKEKAIEALLSRKQADTPSNTILGEHIRKLSDLYRVQFQTNEGQIPVCPVTGKELNGQIPVYALLPGTDDGVNVVSESALKQLGEGTVLREYGAKRKLRLAPPADQLEAIKVEMEARRKRKKKKKKSHPDETVTKRPKVAPG